MLPLLVAQHHGSDEEDHGSDHGSDEESNANDEETRKKRPGATVDDEHELKKQRSGATATRSQETLGLKFEEGEENDKEVVWEVEER